MSKHLVKKPVNKFKKGDKVFVQGDKYLWTVHVVYEHAKEWSYGIERDWDGNRWYLVDEECLTKA